MIGSIRGRIAAIILASTLLAGGVIGALAGGSLYLRAQDGATERADLVAQGIGPVAVEAIAHPDNVDLQLALDSRLAAFRREPGVRRIVILDADGERVPATDDGEAPALRGLGQVREVHGDAVLLVEPLELAGTTVGYMALELTWPQKTLWLQVLGFACLASSTVMLATVGGWVLLTPLTNDLRRVHGAIERLGRGETWVAEDLREGNDELGRLGISIRELAERLERAARQRAEPDVSPESHPDDAPVQLHPISLDVRETLENAIQKVERARGGPIHRELDIPAKTFARLDPLVLQRIVEILLENGIRHGGGEPGAYAHLEDARLCLVVQDTGPGLSDRAVRYLFRPVPGGGVDGTFGVGLALAKRWVTAMGGEISWDARYHRGARFVLHLPSSAMQPEGVA